MPLVPEESVPHSRAVAPAFIFRIWLAVPSAAGVSDKLAEPFMASLAAKGSRESVNSAVEFLDSKIEEEFISEDARDPIKKIMRRFTKYR